MRRALVAFAAVALLRPAPTHGSGQTAPQAPAAAEQARLTPASIALLGNQLDSPALARLRSAISQQDARARAIAARVAGVAKAADLAADLAAALAQETDAGAAAEQVWALLVIDTPYARTAAERHLAQARAPAVNVYLHWLLRTRPERAAEGVERALQPIARDDVHVLTDVVAKAVSELPSVRNQVLAAWLNKATGSAWRRVLDVLPVEAGPPSLALLQRALESDDPLVRQETVWWMVTRIARGGSVETAALDAAAGGGAHLQPANAAAAWETFGREVIARRHRKSPAIDRAELLEREAKRHRPDARALALMPETLSSELSALRRALKDDDPAKSAAFDAKTAARRPGGQSTMRTAPLLWPSLLRELLEESNCRAGKDSQFGAFQIAYRPDGRPASVTLDVQGLPRECEPAIAALARLTLAEPLREVVDKQLQWVIVPLSEEHLECLVLAPPPRQPLPVGGGEIEPPRKISDVRPEYPEAARQNRIQGLVIVEAVISSSGCVTSIEVLHSVHPLLDSAAVKAVSGWRFTPTLLDGDPVAVIMTVTVNFELK